MTRPLGHRRWAVAEGYIPASSTGTSRELASHEAVCILNTGERDAHVQLHVFFTDRAPAGPYPILVPAQRTRHVRLNDLTDPEPIPPATEYSMSIESDEPIVVQHTR